MPQNFPPDPTQVDSTGIPEPSDDGVYSLERFVDGKLYWKCVRCKLWVTPDHLQSDRHKQRLLRPINYPVEAGNLPAQARTQHTENIVELKTGVQTNTEQIAELVTLVQTNTERIAALETLLAKVVGEKFAMAEQLGNAAKLIAELQVRVAAFERRTPSSSSSWSGDSSWNNIPSRQQEYAAGNALAGSWDGPSRQSAGSWNAGPAGSWDADSWTAWSGTTAWQSRRPCPAGSWDAGPAGSWNAGPAGSWDAGPGGSWDADSWTAWSGTTAGDK